MSQLYQSRLLAQFAPNDFPKANRATTAASSSSDRSHHRQNILSCLVFLRSRGRFRSTSQPNTFGFYQLFVMSLQHTSPTVTSLTANHGIYSRQAPSLEPAKDRPPSGIAEVAQRNF